jgi:hypothetical protein
LGTGLKDRQQKGCSKESQQSHLSPFRLLYKHDWAELYGGTMAASSEECRAAKWQTFRRAPILDFFNNIGQRGTMMLFRNAPK